MSLRTFDHKITCAIHNRAHKSKSLDGLAIGAARDYPFVFIAIVFVTLVFESWHAAFLLVVAGFISQILVVLIQKFIVRKRPFQREHLRPLFDMRIKTKSFPSGHSALALVVSSFALIAQPESLFLWIFCTVSAVLIMWSRLHAGLHYVSDVLAGAGFGFIVAYAFSLLVL